MKRLVAIFALFSALGAALMLPAVAQESDQDISVSVTPQNISISVSDGSVDYGILGPSDTANTVANVPTESQSIQNNSNIPVNIHMRSTDADNDDDIVDESDWTLGVCGSVGEDIFGHQFEVVPGVDNTSFDPTAFANDGTFANLNTDSNVTLDEFEGTNDNATLDLGICMPSTITELVPHYIGVTVIASAS